jgi:hypothetical protein
VSDAKDALVINTYTAVLGRPQTCILCNAKKHNTARASGLATDRNLRLVAAKLRNVVLNPIEGKRHVEYTGIGYTLGLDFARGEETKCTKLAMLTVSCLTDPRMFLPCIG